MDVIDDAVNKLKVAIKFVDDKLKGEVTSENFDSELPIDYSKSGLAKTRLRDVVIDCSVIQHFAFPNISIESLNDTMIITFYETKLIIYCLLNSIGIDGRGILLFTCWENSISVTKETLEKLKEKFHIWFRWQHLILHKLPLTKQNLLAKKNLLFQDLKNEPTIGVIDTLFDTKVYFNGWLDYHEELNEVEKFTAHEDQDLHETSVSSLIVDGPNVCWFT